jgi:hypothetical protein
MPPDIGAGTVTAPIIATIPVFPLNVVLFPGGALPLRLFEQRYLGMAKACLKDNASFGVCLIREGREVGAPATPEDVGCTALIEQWDMQQLGVLTILARGVSRFRILERSVDAVGLTRAMVEMLPPESDAPVPGVLRPAVRVLRNALAHPSAPPPHPGADFDSCAWVSARLAELLPLPPPMKQRLLELDDAQLRLERLHRLLEDSGLLDSD